MPAPAGRFTAALEGTVVRAENRAPIPFAKLSLSFRSNPSNDFTSADVEADRDGRFTAHLECDRALRLEVGTCRDARWTIQRFATEGSTEGPPAVVARPGQTVRFAVELAALVNVKGFVVDEAGRPLGGAQLDLYRPNPSEAIVGARMIFTTPPSGAFSVQAFAQPDEVFDAPTASMASALKVRLHDRPTRTFDLRRLSDAERLEWRIVLPKGHRVAGRLVDEGGHPLEAATVSISFGDPEALREGRTDAAGRFEAGAVGDGDAVVGAYVPDGGLEARLALKISADVEDLVLVARPMDLTATPGATNVMGLRLIDLDDATRKAHGLPEHATVMIADAGVVGDGGGHSWLHAGAGILMIGEHAVSDVKNLIDVLLTEYGRVNSDDWQHVRVVVTWGSGTNTQYLWVDHREVERLRSARASMR